MNKDDVLKMIKPNAYTYQGVSKRDIKDLQARYQQAKQALDTEGINTLLRVRLIDLDEKTADFPPFSRKSVLINAIRYSGLDGWTNPHTREAKHEQLQR